MATRLSEADVKKSLERVPGWSEVNGELQRTYSFDDFVQSMSFVNGVAAHAEQVAHHPDILIRYNRVTLTVTTHDAGGLTEKDFALAERCDAMAGAQPA